jgi:hypothetical protein
MDVWQQLSEIGVQIWALVREHWVGVVASLGWVLIGIWWVRRRASQAWNKKEFLDRLNVSLNLIEDGKLLIRTLLETSIDSVMLNKVASDRVLSASRKTTPKDPILPVEAKEAWFLLNAVLNEVAERYSYWEIVRDASHVHTSVRRPVQVAYLLCLTCEAYGEVGELRTRKIRAMMIRRDLLENLPAEAPEFEHPRHSLRWETLKTLAEAWKTRKDYFLEIRLSVPVS